MRGLRLQTRCPKFADDTNKKHCSDVFFFLRVSVGNSERSKTSSKKIECAKTFLTMKRWSLLRRFCVTTIRGSSDGHLNSYVGGAQRQ